MQIQQLEIGKKGDYFPQGLSFHDQFEFAQAKRQRMPVSVIDQGGQPTVILENEQKPLSETELGKILWGDQFVLYACFQNN